MRSMLETNFLPFDSHGSQIFQLLRRSKSNRSVLPRFQQGFCQTDSRSDCSDICSSVVVAEGRKRLYSSGKRTSSRPFQPTKELRGHVHARIDGIFTHVETESERWRISAASIAEMKVRPLNNSDWAFSTENRAICGWNHCIFWSPAQILCFLWRKRTYQWDWKRLYH